jgi:hypothetical protein
VPQGHLLSREPVQTALNHCSDALRAVTSRAIPRSPLPRLRLQRVRIPAGAAAARVSTRFAAVASVAAIGVGADCVPSGACSAPVLSGGRSLITPGGGRGRELAFPRHDVRPLHRARHETDGRFAHRDGHSVRLQARVQRRCRCSD